MEQITTVGIDLAKNVFSLYGVDAAGKAVLRRTVRRTKGVAFHRGVSRHFCPPTYAAKSARNQQERQRM